MKGTPLTDDIYEYIVKHFAMDERALLERMRARAAEAGIPMIMIGEDQAKFVGFFLRAIHARRALDVGTLFGYSAAVMARAIGPSGEVVSLEYSETHANVAKQNLAAEGITNVSIQVGPALEAMKQMPSNAFDFILIDADKPNYINYLGEALRLVRSGGVIAGDNAIAWGKIAEAVSPNDSDYTSVTAIQAFNEEFAKSRNLFSIIVPIGDGMAMGVIQK